MSRIKVFFSVFFVLLRCKIVQTIYVNFKILPLKQAIFLPIFIYTKTVFRSLEGEIIIKGKVYPNMIHIGDNTRYVTTSKPLSVWTINGTIVFEGRMNFYYGTYVYVAKKATLSFGTNGTFLGCNSKIICFKSIKIGSHVEMTWENQIYDTSFHYITDKDGNTEELTLPVVIGDNVWLGNRVTISRCTVLPSCSIVASNSITNKDYSPYGSNCFYAGSPIACKKKDVYRIFDIDSERKLDKKYNYTRYKL